MKVERLKYERIRNLRIDNNLSQLQIAELLHVQQNTYCQYEIGLRAYPIEVIRILAKFYNVSTDYLLDLTDDPTPPVWK